MFPPHSERNIEKRVHLGQDKGAVLAKRGQASPPNHKRFSVELGMFLTNLQREVNLV